MQNPSKALILIITMMGALACGRKNDVKQFERTESFEKVSVGQSNLMTVIPSELWDRLEQFYAGANASLEETISESSGAKQQKIEIPVVFMPLVVFLTEKNFGALGGQNFQISFEQGGGILDLKNYIKKDRKAFYLAVELGEQIEAGKLKVFFVSNSKEFQIGKETYGAGCGKYMDVSSFYKKVMVSAGVELSTAGNRYVPVVTGTYVFALIKNSNLYLSQVTILDSRFKKSLCRG